MDIKKKLLSNKLLDQLNDKSIQIQLEMSATPCQNKWPKCRIYLDDKLKFDNEIQESRVITIKEHSLDSIVTFKIEFYGKTNRDTVVNSDGKILENTSLHIRKCKINGANIIDNGFIMSGKYKMSLNDDKKQYYDDHGYAQESNDYHFYENGSWSLDLAVPVLKGIIEKVRILETFESIPYQNTLEEIYKKIS